MDLQPVTGDRMNPGMLPSLLAKLADRYNGITDLASTPYDDTKSLLTLHEACKKLALDEQRMIYERVWWRTMLYYLGRHWIYYHPRRGWVDKRLAKWIPRPVNNLVEQGHESIMSVFAATTLGLMVRANNYDPQNILTAELIDKLEPVVRASHDMALVQPEFDFWYVLTGNAFFHTYWDARGENGFTTIPYEKCVQCGKNSPPSVVEASGGMCPQCKTGVTRPDPEGGTQIPHGKGATEALSPFDIAAPGVYSKWRDVPFIYRLRWRPREWMEEHLDPAQFKKLSWDKMPAERSLQLMRALGSQSDIGGSPTYSGGGSLSDQEGISEYELWHKPCEKYPDGLVARFLGDDRPTVAIYKDQDIPGPLPFETVKGRKYLPFAHAGYKPVGGRLWARGPFDSATQINDQVNQLNSLAQLCVQRTSNPVWLEPEGADVKHLTGQPGLVVRYNPLLAGGLAKPERIAGENIPQSVMQLLERYEKNFEAATGTYDVIKGQRPPNVQAFSAMQLLVERSQSRFTLPLKNRGEAYRLTYLMQLELERQFGPDERVEAATRPGGGWILLEFKRADLMGDVVLIVEDGSTTPKTNLGQRAAIDQLNALGFLDKTNPEQAYGVHQLFGTLRLMPSLDAHVKTALREQNEFEQFAFGVARMAPEAQGALAEGMDPAALAGMGFSAKPLVNPMVREPWHRDEVHIAQHELWANSDSARRLFDAAPVVKALFSGHMAEHEQAILEKQMQQQALAAPAPGAPGQPGKGPSSTGQAVGKSNKESGNPADVPHGSNPEGQGQGPV